MEMTTTPKTTRAQIKAEIEKTAKESGATELQVITAMQAICAKDGDEKTLTVLCEIKRDYIK